MVLVFALYCHKEGTEELISGIILISCLEYTVTIQPCTLMSRAHDIILWIHFSFTTNSAILIW